jgi:hypothetical protein
VSLYPLTRLESFCIWVTSLYLAVALYPNNSLGDLIVAGIFCVLTRFSLEVVVLFAKNSGGGGYQ